MSQKRQNLRQKLDFIILVMILIPAGFLIPIVSFLIFLWGLSALMHGMPRAH